MSDRKCKVRIDYKKLHLSGERVQKELSTKDLTSASELSSAGSTDEEVYETGIDESLVIEDKDPDSTGEISNLDSLFGSLSLVDDEKSGASMDANDQLIAEESTISEDIDDFMEEHDLNEISRNIDDYDNISHRIEALRTSYRGVHNKLKAALKEDYEDEYKESYSLKLETMKKYIKYLKGGRRKLRDYEEKENEDLLNAKQRKFNVLTNQAVDIMGRLEVRFYLTDDNWKKETDESLEMRESVAQNQITEMQTIPQTIKEMTDSSAGMHQPDDVIRKVKTRYDDLITLKDNYFSRLHKEMKDRLIKERKEFNKSNLNIVLPKFKGYNSTLDYYSFKRDFEKLYGSNTPQDMQSDLLKRNYLANPALLLVKELKDINEIWQRLKDAYGDPKVMLSRRLGELSGMELYGFGKDSTKLTDGLSKLINLMKDLLSLVKEHNIQNHLFYGDTLEKIYKMMGDYRVTRWLTQNDICDEGEPHWNRLVEFLEKELKICRRKEISMGKLKTSNAESSDNRNSKDKEKDKAHKSDKEKSSRHSSHLADSNEPPSCHICSATDHVATNGPGGSKLVQYFACKKFTEMTPMERFEFLKDKGLCFQCLFPGASKNKGKHRNGRCQTTYACKHPDHENFANYGKKHVLVCDEHKADDSNKTLLEEYKTRCILRPNQVELPSYSKEISIMHTTIMKNKLQPNDPVEEDKEDAIYMLQKIQVDGKSYCIFYDSGCREFCVRHKATEQLGDKAVEIREGPITIGGVGGISLETKHGIYSITLPYGNNQEAFMTGVCLDSITEKFPVYPLNKVEADIQDGHRRFGGNPILPKLADSVGGDTDIMIGVTYLRYFPQEIFKMPNGLTLFKSIFRNENGGYGVVGGPHKVFSEINKLFHGSQDFNQFLSTQYLILKTGYVINPDVSMLGFKDKEAIMSDDDDDDYEESIVDIKITQPINSVQRKLKKFQESQDVGTEVTFRCVNCRGCNECKDKAHETVSIRGEVEQHMIEQSVTVDLDERKSTAVLPLISDPKVKLAPNKHQAMKVYKRIVKRLNKCEEDKASIIGAEAMLQALGFVQYIRNLPEEIKKFLRESPLQNFLPWNIIFKESSFSYPWRMVFNASMPTDSGYSLNDVTAKGKNNMNILLEIFIRWRTHRFAFHNDIMKMYNAIKLHPSHWCLQRYLFEPNLDPTKEPEEKVIMTLIYGVKPSGNLAERALRLTAEKFKKEYPQVNEIILKDTYVDDNMSGTNSYEESLRLTDDLEFVLNHGGFTLKGFTVSGSDPAKNVSKDGVSISVAGHKWYPKEDFIKLDVDELNFAKKNRGKHEDVTRKIPEKLTKRICVSKVAQNFDFTGLITPISATWKLDLHEFTKHSLNWDDKIPDNLRPLWEDHFSLMNKLQSLQYKRAVIPEDAVSLDMETLEFGDASRVLVCVAIYVRFLRRNGKYSCQLILGKSKLVPEDLSQPRAELMAAVVNTHAGEIVRKALIKTHKKSIKFTDSQITLNWISNDARAISEQWVRNRCIEIRRFTEPSTWKFVKSEDMIADIGTRRCTSFREIDDDSIWINGLDWMREDESSFPCMTVSEVNKNETTNLPEEVNLASNYWCDTGDKRIEVLRERYQFSKYLVDPNLHRFRDSVRIMALVLRYIKKIRNKGGNKVKSLQKAEKPLVILSDQEIKEAEEYYYRKGTLEIKKYLPPNSYKNISTENNDILIFTGRILPEDDVSIVGQATSIMKDLCTTTFCVPLVDSKSPIAHSIVSEIHWYDKTVAHCGIETTLRYVDKQVHVIDGRALVKRIRTSCQRCRYLAKKTLEISMGPISPYNITIAPAFYVCQVDLAGPFSSYSNHNKRATVKIWLSIFCCCTTSAIKIKLLEDYGSTSFLLAFTRFACDVGYPKRVLVDEGSQLIKGCETMKFDIQDLKFKMYRDVKVELDVCPVGGHNMHGRVERKIRQVKESLDKVMQNERLSIIQWETVSASIANSINNLPLALGNIKGGFESMDLITPNRLLLGRNNDRAPIGTLSVTKDFSKIIASNQRIFDAWFENWLISHVPKLMERPKWYKTERHLKEGDIVLFAKKEEAEIKSSYQYGMVESVEPSRDGIIRKAQIRYRNHNEQINRLTCRSVRTLVVIHPVEEISVMQELGQAAIKVNMEAHFTQKC